MPEARRRRRMLCLAIAIACPLLLLQAGEAGADPERPNILILMAEDMGPRVGAFGDPVAATPHIDRLATEGVRYLETFTTAGVCAPSRAAHITGVHQMALGAQHMRTHHSNPLVPEMIE
jgi:N-sulfoglucosamine sulfohydrolase